MSDKKIVYLGLGLGGTIGSFVPGLWHASVFSLWSIIFSGIGGGLGIWAALKLLNF